jgi:hypothetical protein
LLLLLAYFADQVQVLLFPAPTLDKNLH